MSSAIVPDDTLMVFELWDDDTRMPTPEELRAMAGELLAARRRLRGDSRTAEQVRKAIASIATTNERLERVAEIVRERDKEESKRW